MTHEINIADFAAFCRSKGEDTYRYTDNCGCALAQFVSARDERSVVVVPGFFEYADTGERVFYDNDDLEDAVSALDEADRHLRGRKSFSALADRLDALAEQSHA